MNWTKGNTEWFKSIECVNAKKGIYYINLAPSPYTEEDIESVNMRYINNRVEYIPTTSELKDMLVNIQLQYDSSDEVNGFIVDGEVVWLDKGTRLGLINSLSIQKDLGQEDSTLWLNGQSFTVNIEQALGFLKTLEIYAIECYNVTQLHLLDIQNLQSRDDILNYDVTVGYPSRIVFR